MFARVVRNRGYWSVVKAYSTAPLDENSNKNFSKAITDTEKRDFNAEAHACRKELSDSAISESRQFVSFLASSGNNVTDIRFDKINLAAIFYILGFDHGRRMNDSDISLLSRLLSRVEQCAPSLSVTDLAIIAAAMHRAQLPITDRRLMLAMITALGKCPESSPALRILKILDLSVRRSLPPESLPNDEHLAALAASLSRFMAEPSLSPLYVTRVMRFWQKLRITTPDVEFATNTFFNSVVMGSKASDKRPLGKWRIKDVAQSVFSAGFFAYRWSHFAESALEEVEYRLSSGKDYSSEIEDFPDAYFQSIFGLLTHSNCTEQERIRKVVKSNDVFSRPPSPGARSIEAWRSVRVACGLDVNDSFISSKNADLGSSDWHSQRLTGRQYMALQVADAARAAFPGGNVRIVQLLPAFASEAKVDVVIENIISPTTTSNSLSSISLLPLPELACFRRLVYSKVANNQQKQLVSFYRPQGSELLRLRCVVSSGLVERSLPILWPTWRGLRENNRHIYIRNLVMKTLSSVQ